MKVAVHSVAVSVMLVLSLAGCSKNSTDSPGAQADQTASGRAQGEHHRGINFDELDKNKDGKVTQDEAGDAWKFLSKADTNGDGAITKDELQAMHPHNRAD